MTERSGKGMRNGTGLFRLAPLIISIIFILAMLAAPVSAQGIRGAFSSMGSSIGGFFDDYASTEGPTVIDFLLFAIIFFAICWIGFGAVFKDAKNANVVLSLALGLALSVALVYGGKFTLKKLLPFAAMILLILLMIGIFALLRKFIFTKDTAGSKLIAAVFAIIISVALLIIAFNFICDSGSCENNAFLRKVFGSESIIGRLLSGAGGIFEGGPLPSQSPNEIAANAAQCQNGVLDPGERCDVGPEGEASLGCDEGYICDNCERCVAEGASASVASFFSSGWTWAVIVLVVLLILLLWKRKSLNERLKNWRARRKNKAELSALNKLLNKLRYKEKHQSEHVKQLIENIKQEKTPFEATRHIIDLVTHDIKDTIGQEMDIVKAEEKEGLFNNIKRLHQLNHNESALVQNMILPTIKEETAIITEEIKLNEEMAKRMNELENVGEHFKDHAEIIDTFKHYDFKEKNVITNMMADLKANEANFTSLHSSCTQMLALLDDEERRLKDVETGREAGKRITYDEVVRNIKEVRSDAIKLNGIFMSKINTLRYIVMKMKELQEEIRKLHSAEVENIEDFKKKALESESTGHFDRAAYFAWHVVENSHFLSHVELSPEDRAKLSQLDAECTAIIKRCLPRAIDSILPTIEDELVKEKFNEVKETLKHLKKMSLSNSKTAREVKMEIDAYTDKIKLVEELCERMMAVAASRDEVKALIS
jgi:hypothetical protein